jgi:protein SCO1
MISRRTILASAGLLAAPGAVLAHGAGHDADEAERLPVIGPAPDFTLTAQDGRTVRMTDLRGKVVAVSFIYTSCPDVCPMLTAQMVQVQGSLGKAFGRTVEFVSITVDPERDTPAVLARYADDYGADLGGWLFLTGEPAALADVGRRFGIFMRKRGDGEIDHTLLTSLVDRTGVVRIQYLGARFDPGEFLSDIVKLLDEAD